MTGSVIANWAETAGLDAALQVAGLPVWADGPTGSKMCAAANLTAVTSFVTAYSGSATQLAYAKAQKQVALDALLDGNFDLKAFIRAGSSTGVTAAGVGTFLATITNNYRTLRASIAAAIDVATVTAINISSGWPGNP